MKYYTPCLLSLLLALGAVGCSPKIQQPPKSAFAVREIQTRTFETKDTKLVMKAVLNALQDDGFITRNAVVDLGLITATRETDMESSASRILGTFFGGENPSWQKVNLIEATINVSEFGKGTRVRVSFQRKLLDNRGGTMYVAEVEEPLMYQDFFMKVDKSIFIQKERV